MDGVQGPKWGCGWPEAPRRGPPSVVAGTVFMLLAGCQVDGRVNWASQGGRVAEVVRTQLSVRRCAHCTCLARAGWQSAGASGHPTWSLSALGHLTGALLEYNRYMSR
jgi:hypothetical protein